MATCNITTQNDCDWVRSFVYQTLLSDGVTLGPPVDLTGNTMRMGIRRHAEDAAEEILLTTENGGITITDAVNGKFTVWLTQAQLVVLGLGDYDHSLIRMPPTGGLHLRIWSGVLTNTAGPSR
jgi:hypothetical protein